MKKHVRYFPFDVLNVKIIVCFRINDISLHSLKRHRLYQATKKITH